MSRSKDCMLEFIKVLKNLCRCCDSKISTWAVMHKNPTKVKNEEEIPKVIRKFFKERSKLHLLSGIPKKYLTRTSYADFCVIVDPKIATRIGHVICSRFDGDHLIEFDPGLGYMSNILITSTPHLRLCETNPEFRSKLEVLRLIYRNKVDIHDVSVSAMILGSTSFKPFYIKRFESVFDGIPERSWKDAPSISFILTVLRKQLVRAICRNLVLEQNFHKFGRSEFYYIIPTHVYQDLVATPNNEFKGLYRSTAVLFQSVFDYEVLLDGVPRWVILPWPSRKKHNQHETTSMVVLRAIPKINFFETFQNKTLIRSFFNFLSFNVRKNRRIIPSIEAEVGNCGPVFIMNFNLTNYSEFVELSPKEILSIFLQLSEFPSFKHSSLYSSAKNLIDDTDDEGDGEGESIT